MPFYARLLIVIVLVMAASEVAPAAVNALLLLILLGMILANYTKFAGLISQASQTK